MLIKSPLNYIGGKYKILPQLLRLFPSRIHVCYDLFSGGCNVGINAHADQIVCNDTQRQIINLLQFFQQINNNDIIEHIESLILYYQLSNSTKHGYAYYGCNSNKGLGKYNKPRYEKLRTDFNQQPLYSDELNYVLMFYTLIIFAFNNQIRFNASQQFNMPVGKRDFNKSVHKNLIQFITKIQNTNIRFTNHNYTEFFNQVAGDDFVYCDPPYLISCATYNENNQWTEKNESELLSFLDQLHRRNIRFALSNVLYHKNQVNILLKNWSKSYTVHLIENNFNNCNYQVKNKTDKATCEVLVTNY